MDWVMLGGKLREISKQYRFVLLILLLGIMLMLMPDFSEKSQTDTDLLQSPIQASTTDLEESLAQILSKMDGAGKVQVLLTEAQGERIHYQTNENRSQSDSTAELRQETVIVSGSDRSESGLVWQTEPPVYLGAVILCQGADSAAVRLAIIQAVANATGLSTDKISVLKMK